MKKAGPITGTFIDEITYDIPSSNWSDKQWCDELDNMLDIGIDTLIFIRGGLKDKTIFPSKTFGTEYRDDFAKLIFEEAQKRNMGIYFGLYNTTIDWSCGNVEQEVRVNDKFMDEVLERYGHFDNFKGWYMSQECDLDRLNFKDMMRDMPRLCKSKSPDKELLISPFFNSPITAREPFSLSRLREEWEMLFDRGNGNIDICAFQDGTAPLEQMEDYFGLINELCKQRDIRHWVNVETFERDVRRMYYPIPFSELKPKLEKHKKYAEKMITFEFSHFMSPQSIYPSARNLNALYKDYYLK